MRKKCWGHPSGLLLTQRTRNQIFPNLIEFVTALLCNYVPNCPCLAQASSFDRGEGRISILDRPGLAALPHACHCSAPINPWQTTVTSSYQERKGGIQSRGLFPLSLSVGPFGNPRGGIGRGM